MMGKLSRGFSKGSNNKFYHSGLVGLNQHSPFTVAAMYLKAIDPNSSTSSIPGKIASFYFNLVPIFTDMDCDPLNLLNITSQCRLLPIMHLNTTYNAYWWFHFGWSRGVIVEDNNNGNCIESCRRPCVNITEFMEDFSHAGIAMEFPIHSIPFLGQYFNSSEMLRWRNTFSKLIWAPYNLQGPGFHSAVNGDTDDGIDSKPANEGGCLDYFNCPNYREVPLLFAPLYKFDVDDGYDVYDIVMQYYQNTVELAVITKDASWLNERTFLGLSRTVAAQWDKECTNLTLYNRDVVYNQDFFAKNILTIAPQQTTDVFYTKGHL